MPQGLSQSESFIQSFSAFSCGMEPCCSECGILLLNALAVHISQLVAQF